MPTNKITCRLAGGLGNQLFELSYAIYLAKKSNIKNINLDVSGLHLYKAKHTNHLNDYFNFSNSSINIIEKKSFLTRFRLPRLFGFKLKHWPLISDKNRDAIVSLKSSSIIDGYFIWALEQHNFDLIVNELKSFLKVDNTININPDTCVVHIRGGDFVDLGWNKLTPISYYTNAMDIMVNQFNVKKFLVITDDLQYTTDLLKECDFDYEVHSNDMKTDFFTILNSQKKIIGGSSFAIWAAALGYNLDGGKTIAPVGSVKLPNQINQ